MFRPQIQKTNVLVLIAIFNIVLVYFCSKSFEYIDRDGRVQTKDLMLKQGESKTFLFK